MSIKILTKSGTEVTAIDDARANNFDSGNRSGIVKGALNEGTLFMPASNIIAIESCELRIAGHRIIIDSAESITLLNKPSSATRYSLIAEIVVSDLSVPSFRLFIQPATNELIKENLYKTLNGNGTYQLKIGNFTLRPDGTISDIVRVVDIISGGTSGGLSDIVFKATAETIASGLDPEVNVDYNEETGEYDMHFALPSSNKINSVNGKTGDVNLTAEDVKSLPDTTKYGAGIDLTIDSSTYVVTAQLKDQNGNNLGQAKAIDLPLESVVVNGAYDSTTKQVVLTLDNGSEIKFSVADLVSGLQTQITSTNKLASDLVDDTNSINKFVTQGEKDKLTGIEQGANKTIVDTALSTISTNPVQNKAVTNAVNTNMLGIPSNSNYVNIAWSGSTYTYFTAPANGYVYMRATGQWADNLLRIRIFTNSSMNIEKIGTFSQYNGTYYSSCCSCPVKKGDYCEFLPVNITNLVMQFVPAEGV